MRENSFIPVSDYSYDLPEFRIARYPLPDREKSRLLVYKNGLISEHLFKDIIHLLPEGSSLVINNTKVIHARLQFFTETKACIEVFCLEPEEPSGYERSLASKGECIWKCMIGNLKKWKQSNLEAEVETDTGTVLMTARKIQVIRDGALVQFTWKGDVPFGKILEYAGSVPIPPYLNRKPESIDNDRYQTVYSLHDGSVAAPTAGFHFTSHIMDNLGAQSISLIELTLHVGAGTFQPVKSENALDHSMHNEFFTVNLDTLIKLQSAKRPIIATGTTTLRTLESLYWLAVKSIENGRIVNEIRQWDDTIINGNLTFSGALAGLINMMEKEGLQEISAHTGIMIVPGYRFRAVDILITNFHQPRSTLLLLVAAFTGNDWKEIYQYALENDFRFLSYGDSSMLYKSPHA